jgi:hypothetical protein
MKIARDTRTFIQLRFQSYVELMSQLPKAELIDEPQQQ